MLSKIMELTAEREVLKKDISFLEQKIVKANEEKERAEEARSILILAAKKTQKNISTHFSKLVDQAFEMIWENPYKFIPEFVERRGRTECDLWFERNGKRMKPRFATGGGPKDVASFVLRLAYSRLERTAPILALDEPFRFVSVNLRPAVMEVLQFLAEEFKIQFIITTHQKELMDGADKVFSIEKAHLKQRRRGK